MTEPRKEDRWNSLLESLGVPASEKPTKAEVTPSTSSDAPAADAPAPVRPQPISMLPPEKPKAAARPKPAAPVAKSPSYWSRIAGALGLEVPPEAPQPPPAVVTAHVPPPPAMAEPPRAVERPSRFGPPRQEVEVARPEPITKNPLQEMFGAPPADVDVFRGERPEEPPRLREPSPTRNREEEETGAVLDYEREDSDLPLLPPARDQRRVEGEERDGPRRRRGRRGRRGRGEGREEGRDEVRSPSRGPAVPRREEQIEPAGEEVDFELEREDDLEAELDVDVRDVDVRDEQGPREGRSGRDEQRSGERDRSERDDRGRGRQRRPARRSSGSERRPSSYSAADEGEEKLKSRVPEPARDEHYEDSDLDLDSEHEEGDEEHAPGMPTHKKIPTWDEAVGILIDANMSSRAANPERDRGWGRGRGGRGRGRGR